ncbi:retinol dehydrogenase 7-like [Diadema antillarum]|uniref:retinol dehydrogenase 7-like n=1 Tax=Diadema antillarum TaxID=105358 RepID=UPI003A8C2773
MGACLVAFGFVLISVVAKLLEVWLRRSYIANITKDKYVFITGCDTGFGNGLARQLDTKGVKVIATCLTEQGCTNLRDATSERTTILQMDITNHESVLSAFTEVKKIIPHQAALWGVVNNAGIANLTGYVEWSKLDDYRKVLSVNLLGAIDVTLTFLPLLKKSRGRLVNVTSCAGRLASMTGGYCESKFALEAFSDVVRRQVRTLGYGIQVSIIEPGFFATNVGSREVATKSVTSCWQRLTKEEQLEFPEEMLNTYLNTKLAGIVSLLSTDIQKVTDTMEHALFAKWPRTRYVVGWDAKFAWIPMSLLPTRLADILVP